MEGRNWCVTTESDENLRFTSVEDIVKELGKVREGASEFIVVENVPNSEDQFFQASVWTESVILARSYVAEVRLPAANGFRQWRLRTKDFLTIEDSMSRFCSGEDPVGAKWDEVTDEFI